MTASSGLLWNLIGIVTALLAIGYAYFKWSFQYWKKRNIPFLEPTIPFGNFGSVLSRSEYFGDWARRLYNEGKSKGYKYFGVYLFSLPILVLTDLELTKHVMTKDFSNFVDRGLYINEKDDPLSDHLFATTGKKWRNLRIKLTPTFTSGKMKAMFQTLVDCGLVLEKYIEDRAGDNNVLDIKNILECYSTDIIGSCAFGLDCNSFIEPNSPFRVFGKRAFNPTALENITNLFTLSFPKLSRFLHLRTIPKDVSDFYMKTVQNTVDYREKNNVKRKDFMQLLIEMKQKDQPNGHTDSDDGTTLTMNDITAQSFIFFLAGYETSSTTMTFTLYNLATHPEIQDKVREEINVVLEKHNNKVTYDSLSEMKYMSQVIDETLRIYPPVTVLQRIAGDDYKLPGEDVIIEKGTSIFIPIYGYQHDKENFSNPEVFDPDRFNDENKKNIRQYSTMPFGEGPRICIGERFGLMQTRVGLISVLRQFKISVNKKTIVPLKMAVTSPLLSIEGGLWLNFEKI